MLGLIKKSCEKLWFIFRSSALEFVWLAEKSLENQWFIFRNGKLGFALRVERISIKLLVHFKKWYTRVRFTRWRNLEKNYGSFLEVVYSNSFHSHENFRGSWWYIFTSSSQSSLYFCKKSWWFIFRSSTLVSALLAGQISRKLVVHFRSSILKLASFFEKI